MCSITSIRVGSQHEMQNKLSNLEEIYMKILIDNLFVLTEKEPLQVLASKVSA